MLQCFDMVHYPQLDPETLQPIGCNMERFKNLPKELALRFFKSDNLFISVDFNERSVAEAEKALFDVAVGWIEHQEERVSDAEEILRCIRYGIMTSEQLKEVSTCKYVNSSNSCLKLIMEAEEFHSNELSKPLYPESLHHPRGDLQFIFEDVDNDQGVLEFTGYDNRDFMMKYKDISPFPVSVLNMSIKAIQVGHFVYLMAITTGTGFYGNVMYRCSASWQGKDLKKLTTLEGSGRFWAVAAGSAFNGDHIVVAGGILMQDWMISQEPNFHRHVTNTCFKYSIRSDSFV